MAIRLRTVEGHRLALCAAASQAKRGDRYLDDADHEALGNKFAREDTKLLQRMGYDITVPGCWDDAALVAAEEVASQATETEEQGEGDTENAAAQLLIELAFLVPKGTDLSAFAVKLTAYTQAVQAQSKADQCREPGETEARDRWTPSGEVVFIGIVIGVAVGTFLAWLGLALA
jgi:hypothetical protein